MKKNELNGEKIVLWLREHPYFSQNAMCQQLGIDVSNLHKAVKNGHIPVKHLQGIVSVIKNYGFKM